MQPRIDIVDVPYHIFSRGNNQQEIFLDDQDRQEFLFYLQLARRKFDFLLYTYSLMDNHYHFLLEMKGASSLARLMHALQLGYAKYFHKRYRRVGHLFQGRYGSNLVDTDRYFLAVDRYIHLNPVHAGMVARPEDYPWSSYSRRLARQDESWICHSAVLDYFGQETDTQIAQYRKFTDEGIAKPPAWSHELLQKASYLGSAAFVQTIQSKIAKPL